MLGKCHTFVLILELCHDRFPLSVAEKRVGLRAGAKALCGHLDQLGHHAPSTQIAALDGAGRGEACTMPMTD
jgi:hypothetical protein